MIKGSQAFRVQGEEMAPVRKVEGRAVLISVKYVMLLPIQADVLEILPRIIKDGAVILHYLEAVQMPGVELSEKGDEPYFVNILEFMLGSEIDGADGAIIAKLGDISLYGFYYFLFSRGKVGAEYLYFAAAVHFLGFVDAF